MNCNFVNENVQAIVKRSLAAEQLTASVAHIEACTDCRAALRGAEALAELRMRKPESAADNDFDKVVRNVISQVGMKGGSRRFWAGAGFGGALAASIFAMALIFGWTERFQSGDPMAAEFVVTLGEPRQMDLAFESERDLDGATISILLSGDVGIEGYGLQRELIWTENLEAGINRLSLPIIANGINGGQMIVSMTHPLSKRVFVISVVTSS